MKKIIAFILAFVLCITIVACAAPLKWKHRPEVTTVVGLTSPTTFRKPLFSEPMVKSE